MYPDRTSYLSQNGANRRGLPAQQRPSALARLDMYPVNSGELTGTLGGDGHAVQRQ
ncbi:hypothetical protein [Deinococcus rubellus]|uniref:Uncharacterized protein n=1 Tax=Deinococcus rubellus TaxID=1889240 RepID=A0ABY5YDJ1_9DEIO|nr:hypothetical protein [Deinococcus rubellus]UWX63135.1 hypothetical protein N0D28_10235 [Deinococcus rubellus]